MLIRFAGDYTQLTFTARDQKKALGFAYVEGPLTLELDSAGNLVDLEPAAVDISTADYNRLISAVLDRLTPLAEDLTLRLPNRR